MKKQILAVAVLAVLSASTAQAGGLVGNFHSGNVGAGAVAPAAVAPTASQIGGFHAVQPSLQVQAKTGGFTTPARGMVGNMADLNYTPTVIGGQPSPQALQVYLQVQAKTGGLTTPAPGVMGNMANLPVGGLVR